MVEGNRYLSYNRTQILNCFAEYFGEHILLDDKPDDTDQTKEFNNLILSGGSWA